MRKAYNIVVTVFLCIVLVANFVLVGRQTNLLWHLALDGNLEMMASLYVGNFMYAYLLGIPLTFIILIVRIILTIRGDKTESTKTGAVQIAGKLGTLLEEQRIVVKDWLAKVWDKRLRNVYFVGGGLVLALFLVYYTRSDPNFVRPVEGFIACLFCGEVMALAGWLLSRRNPDKIITKYEKHIKKAFGDSDVCEVFAGDVLSVGDEWKYRDEVKDELGWGVVGSRYIVHFTEVGIANVVDSTKLSRVSTATTYYYTGKGVARQRHDVYEVRFYYEKEKRKNHVDVTFQFKSDANRSVFLNLLKSRFGEQIEIVQE